MSGNILANPRYCSSFENFGGILTKKTAKNLKRELEYLLQKK